MKELKVGDKVKVMRKTGKDGIPTEVTGEILKFNSIIRINGEPTATILYDDGDKYAHAISAIQLIEQQQ